MEDLFWTKLNVDGREVVDYHIVFENDEYLFILKDSFLKNYRFKREHDEWHTIDNMPEGLMHDAVEELEKYLLRQH